MFFDRTGKERNLKVGDIVYLFCTAKKPVQSSKFWRPWTGPFKVVASLSRWNYGIRNLRGIGYVVHVNRLKQFYKQGIWNEKGRKDVTGSSG